MRQVAGYYNSRIIQKISNTKTNKNGRPLNDAGQMRGKNLYGAAYIQKKDLCCFNLDSATKIYMNHALHKFIKIKIAKYSANSKKVQFQTKQIALAVSHNWNLSSFCHDQIKRDLSSILNFQRIVPSSKTLRKLQMVAILYKQAVYCVPQINFLKIF